MSLFILVCIYLFMCFYILFRTLNNPYDQLLYYHSAVCHHGLQRFLNRNPIYWCFVPQSSAEVKLDDEYYYSNMKQNKDNQSTTVNTFNIVKDSPKATTTSKKPFLFAPLLVDINRTTEETNRFIHNIPKPPNGYEFSQRQFDEQFQLFFDRKENQVAPSDYVDLYQYTVVAVCKLTLSLTICLSMFIVLVPDTCSRHLRRFIESLFVTHTETKLNLLGRLIYRYPYVIFDSTHRGNWCVNLIRPTNH